MKSIILFIMLPIFILSQNADPNARRVSVMDGNNINLKGYGIEVSVRYLQFDRVELQDVFFRVYIITNASAYNYEKVVFGNLTGSYVGGAGDEWNDDVAVYDPRFDMVFLWDYHNFVRESANPLWEGSVGRIGEKIIVSPKNNGLTSFDYFVPAGDITMSDEEDIWSRLKPGYFNYPASVLWESDSTYRVLRGEDGDYLYGSGYFPLLRGQNDTLVSLIIFGDKPEDINQKALIAEAFWNSKFVESEAKNRIKFTNLSESENLFDSGKISWEITKDIKTIDIYFSYNGGKNWELLKSDLKNVGEFNFTKLTETSLGLFRLFFKDSTHKIVSYSTSGFVKIDNPSKNAPPLINIDDKIIADKDTLITDNLVLNTLIGDPDNDSLTLLMYYSNGINNRRMTDWIFLDSSSIDAKLIHNELTIFLNDAANAPQTAIKLVVSDGISTGMDSTEFFRKFTERDKIDSIYYKNNYWNSNAQYIVNIVNNKQLLPHTYKITFDDLSEPNRKYYSIYDESISKFIFNHEIFYSSVESKIFNGLSFMINDIETKFNPALSYHPDSIAISVELLNMQQYKSYPSPNDYKIIFFDSLLFNSDTSNILPLKSVPINYEIIRMRDQVRINSKCVVTSEHVLSRVFFIEPINNNTTLTWVVDFIHGIRMNKADTFYLSFDKGVSFF